MVLLITLSHPAWTYDLESVRERYCEFQTELQKTYSHPVFLKYRIENEYTPAFFSAIYAERHLTSRQTFNPPTDGSLARLLARGEYRDSPGETPLPFERDLIQHGLRRWIRAQLVLDPLTLDFHGETDEPVNTLQSGIPPLKRGTLGNPAVLVTHYVDVQADEMGRPIQTPRYEVHHAIPADRIHPVTGAAPLDRRRAYEFVSSHTEGLAEAMMMLDGVWSDWLAEPAAGEGVPFHCDVQERNELVCVVWKRGNKETAEQYETLFQPGDPWLPVELQSAGQGYRQSCAFHYDRTADGLLYFKGYDSHTAWAEADDAIVHRECLTIERFTAPLELPRNMFTVAENPEESVFFPMPKPFGIRHGTFAKAFLGINGLVIGIVIWLIWTGRRRPSQKKYDSPLDEE